MRYYDQGSGYAVKVSRQEVEAFAETWPCCRLPRRAITFYFNNNGDLVDLYPDGVDGPEAVALSEDAQAYGALCKTRSSRFKPDRWLDYIAKGERQ